jgi:hypothetical protein
MNMRGVFLFCPHFLLFSAYLLCDPLVPLFFPFFSFSIAGFLPYPSLLGGLWLFSLVSPNFLFNVSFSAAILGMKKRSYIT